MKGIKGWGESDLKRSANGEELISTSDLRAVFPELDRSYMFRRLTRSGVHADPNTRGLAGERYWPRQPAIKVLATRKRRK